MLSEMYCQFVLEKINVLVIFFLYARLNSLLVPVGSG